MHSRKSVDQGAQQKSAKTDPRTNLLSVVGVYRCCVNSDPEFFVRFWPYIKYATKKKPAKTDVYHKVKRNEGHRQIGVVPGRLFVESGIR